MKNEEYHQRQMVRLERASLNHHVHIGAVIEESAIMQAVIDQIEIHDQNLLALILVFAKENYIKRLGFQSLFESDKYSYVTCSVESEIFYQFIAENDFSDEKFQVFLSKAKIAGVPFFDISFPEEFYK